MRLLRRSGHVNELSIPEYVPELLGEDIDVDEISTSEDSRAAFREEIQAYNDRLMQEADDYDMSQFPHRGSRSFIQSTRAISSSSAMTTSTSAMTDLARSDADLPLITDEARHGALDMKMSRDSDPPMAKLAGAIELAGFNHRSQGMCAAVGMGSDICPLFRNGGDLGGFERNGWVPMPCPMVIDSSAAETVLPSAWFKDH